MNTKQTPEEKYEVSESKYVKGKFFMADCGQDLNGRKFYIISNNATPHAKDFCEKVVQLLNNSCPVCDSMAERNRELMEGLRKIKDLNSAQNANSFEDDYSVIMDIAEQLLSNQNNKT